MGIATGGSSYILASGVAFAGTMSTSASAAVADASEAEFDSSTFEYGEPGPFFARSKGSMGASGGGGRPARAEETIKLLDHSDYKKRVAAADRLGETKAKGAIDRLVKMARGDSSRHARQAAIAALGKIGDPSLTGTIAEIARCDSSDEVCQICVRALLEMNNPGAMEEIVAIARNNPKQTVRGRAVQALASARDERAIPYLIASLSDRSINHDRFYLNQFGSQAVPQLIESLKNGNSSARMWSAVILREAKDARAGIPLVETIRKDPDENVRQKAIQAIAIPEVADTLTLASLCEGLDDPDENVRKRCSNAIHLLARRVGDVLVDISQRDDSPLARRAAVALARLGDKRAITGVLKAIYDESAPPDFRMEALEAYARIEDPTAASSLAAVSRRDKVDNPELQRRIESHLARMANTGSSVGTTAGAKAAARRRTPDEGIPWIEKIADEIARKLANALELSTSPQLFASDIETYDEVSLGGPRRLSPTPGQRQTLLPPNETIAIDEGTDEETRRTILVSLNFLVHHAMAHLLQQEMDIPEPEIDTARFPRFNPERIRIAANEAMLDGLALDMATKIYVAGRGDILFGEDIRAAISINAAIALHELILSNHRLGRSPLSHEEIARMVAVERAMAMRDSACKNAKHTLRGIANTFRATVVPGMNEKHSAEFSKLMKALKEIFDRAVLK